MHKDILSVIIAWYFCFRNHILFRRQNNQPFIIRRKTRLPSCLTLQIIPGSIQKSSPPTEFYWNRSGGFLSSVQMSAFLIVVLLILAVVILLVLVVLLIVVLVVVLIIVVLVLVVVIGHWEFLLFYIQE